MNKGKLFGAFTAAAMCATMMPAIPALPASAASVGDKLSVSGGQTQHKGNCDGYSYEVWLDNTGGSGSMTLGKGATFKAEWSASVSRGNFLARRGLDFGSKQKATSYDYIGMDYKADYRQTGSASGNSRLCVYGWFQNRGASGNPPLVEYYIIEDWVDWCPDGNGKMVTIDGAQYKIFQNDHTGPSINSGSETFKQYFSVRQQKRTSGHITVSDHFKAWEQQGWGIGNLYEVALNAEGWQSSGVADVTELDVYTDPNKAGQGVSTTTEPTEPPKVDSDGYWFHHTFEKSEDGWSGRSADVETSSKAKLAGSKSLYVSGRTNDWNGGQYTLGAPFEAGEAYSFSGCFYYDEGDATRDFKLTLEYNDGSDTTWAEIASGTASKGEWVQLSNTNYKLPSGSGYKLIVETTDGTTEPFYVDEIIGAPKGTKIDSGAGQGTTPTSGNTNPTNPPSGSTTRGDLNGDKRIDMYDMVLVRQAIIKGMSGSATDPAADIDGNGTLNVNDLVLLSKFLLGQEKTFPATTTTTTTTTKTTTTTTTKGASNGDLMAKVKSEFTTSVPGNIKSNADTGSTKKISYPSKATGTNKPANVWVPKGYDSSKKYNVLYMNHGVMGGEGDMLSGWGIREMASYFIDNGEVDPFIIVFPQMYSAQGGGGAAGINMDVMDNYDRFLQDMTDSLMPYIEQNYSVNTGRDHTAIAGFSMGGRESLYLTIMRPDLFGYCCASSPAPGIVPASDMFISNHLGSKKADGSRMTNNDFKIAKSDMPYLLMIGGGTNDSVVGTFPKQYHELFDKNGTDNIWHEFPGAGHDAGVGTPMFYNFFKNLWKG